MTDRLQKRQSAAYAALSEAGRKVLTAVENEVAHGGGVAVLTFNQILRRCDLSRSAAANGLKQIELWRFEIQMGGPPSFTRTIKLVDHWQAIGPDEARQLQLRSRLPMAKRQAAPQPVAPRERRMPSLPVLHWRDDAR